MQHKNFEKSKIIIQVLGDIVREKRNQLGKSQRLFADEFGVEKSLVNRVENGTNEVKLLSLFTISEMFGLKPSELLLEIENRLPSGFSVLEN